MRLLTPTFPERGIQAGLADRALVRSEIYIAGEWRKANDGGLLSVRNPATGEWLGSVAAAGPDEALAGITGARAVVHWIDRSGSRLARPMRRHHGLDAFSEIKYLCLAVDAA